MLSHISLSARTNLGLPAGSDVIAGISVALILIPQSLAYAELAGLPPQHGLFASALPPLLAAPFVSSPFLQTGPVALTSLLTLGALTTMAEAGSVQYIHLAALLALMVGAIRCLMGLLRLGSVAYLLSAPVLTGFTTAAAILIAASQLPRSLGVESTGAGVLPDAFEALSSPQEWSALTILITASTMILILVGRRLHRLFPGVLIAVIVWTLVSSLTDYSGSTVGKLSGDFVRLSFGLPWGSTLGLLPAACAIALIGFAEPSSIARAFAAQERQTWDANREMLSQGVANLAAGISGAFPVGGSFSRSSLNRFAGAKSRWSGAVTGAFVLLALPFTGLLDALPRAVLGAIVISAVLQLIQFRPLVGLVRESWPQALVGIGTLAATLALAPGVERGVIAGVALAFVVHAIREMTITMKTEMSNGVLRVYPRGVLWFAAVARLEDGINKAIAAHTDIEQVVFDLGGVGRLDYTGGVAIGRIVDDLSVRDIDATFDKVPPAAMRALRLHLHESCSITAI